MSSSPPPAEPRAIREAIVVAVLTAVGALIRAWSLGRLGLVHFDEGMYAMAGLWSSSPRGLAGLAPAVIPYAPPGFPFLVGVAYAMLGVGDLAAILVSIAAGTLTIPIAGWLGRRSFGPGAGAAAAAFAALSGPHIAFSRMALTDASFLLFWLIAIGLGQRFLERPGPLRAAVLGVAVGVAQLFKYNGWLAGAIVMATAAVLAAFRPEDRAAKHQAAVWGWGLAAALVAAAVYWPWFRFVEDHGGYSALLTHQRGYLSGFDRWPAHLFAQLDQDRVLSGGTWWLLVTGLVAAAAMRVAVVAPTPAFRDVAGELLCTITLPAFCLLLNPLVGCLPFIFCFIGVLSLSSSTRTFVLLAVGWAVMAALTPFYHPYARLFLPYQALTWLGFAGLFWGVRRLLAHAGTAAHRSARGQWRRPLAIAAVVWLGPLLLTTLTPFWAAAQPIAVLLEPSDSLRNACQVTARALPRDLEMLRFYARPPVTFYLSRAVRVAPQPGLDRLFEAAPPRTWALLDMAIIRQEGGPQARLEGTHPAWDLVREVPTTLNLPTLLDVDPSSATRTRLDRAAPLLLFRPKPPSAAR